jgi:hypothetical protein
LGSWASSVCWTRQSREDQRKNCVGSGPSLGRGLRKAGTGRWDSLGRRDTVRPPGKRGPPNAPGGLRSWNRASATVCCRTRGSPVCCDGWRQVFQRHGRSRRIGTRKSAWKTAPLAVWLALFRNSRLYQMPSNGAMSAGQLFAGRMIFNRNQHDQGNIRDVNWAHQKKIYSQQSFKPEKPARSRNCKIGNLYGL